jgi:hypothetical protein
MMCFRKVGIINVEVVHCVGRQGLLLRLGIIAVCAEFMGACVCTRLSLHIICTGHVSSEVEDSAIPEANSGRADT